MKIIVDWDTFNLRFFKDGGTIFVKETPISYEFYTYEGPLIIYSEYIKQGNNEDNIMFIERYMTDKSNLVKVSDIDDGTIKELEEEYDPQEPEEDYSVSLIETKPFAGYENFDACVAANKDKKDPEAYCATIMRKVEGKDGQQ